MDDTIDHKYHTSINIPQHQSQKHRSSAYLFNTQQTRAFTKGFGSKEVVTAITVAFGKD